jgi:hypothetical protein
MNLKDKIALGLTLITILLPLTLHAQAIKISTVPARLLAQACQTLIDRDKYGLNYDDNNEKKFDVVVCRTYIRG